MRRGFFRGFTLSFFFCGLASGILFSLLLGSIFSCYALCFFLRRTLLRFVALGRLLGPRTSEVFIRPSIIGEPGRSLQSLDELGDVLM